MTEYIILRSTQADPNTPSLPLWERLPDTYEASSARRALSAATVRQGEYVAVPARSFVPLTVKTEQVTKVTIG